MIGDKQINMPDWIGARNPDGTTAPASHENLADPNLWIFLGENKNLTFLNVAQMFFKNVNTNKKSYIVNFQNQRINDLNDEAIFSAPGPLKKQEQMRGRFEVSLTNKGQEIHFNSYDARFMSGYDESVMQKWLVQGVKETTDLRISKYICEGLRPNIGATDTIKDLFYKGIIASNYDPSIHIDNQDDTKVPTMVNMDKLIIGVNHFRTNLCNYVSQEDKVIVLVPTEIISHLQNNVNAVQAQTQFMREANIDDKRFSDALGGGGRFTSDGRLLENIRFSGNFFLKEYTPYLDYSGKNLRLFTHRRTINGVSHLFTYIPIYVPHLLTRFDGGMKTGIKNQNYNFGHDYILGYTDSLYYFIPAMEFAGENSENHGVFYVETPFTWDTNKYAREKIGSRVSIPGRDDLQEPFIVNKNVEKIMSDIMDKEGNLNMELVAQHPKTVDFLKTILSKSQNKNVFRAIKQLSGLSLEKDIKNGMLQTADGPINVFYTSGPQVDVSRKINLTSDTPKELQKAIKESGLKGQTLDEAHENLIKDEAKNSVVSANK